MAKNITTKIEDLVRHTFNIPEREIAKAAKGGQLTLDGKLIKAGATVTVKAGATISCGRSRVQIVESHLMGLRQFQNVGPSFILQSKRDK